MTKKYQRLNVAERRLIEQHLKEGKSQSWISKALGRHKSTICRELRKKDYSRHGYHSREAQKLADTLKERNRRTRKIQGGLEAAVLYYLLELQCSPFQIEGRLKRKYPGISELHVSQEIIYKYVYASPLKQIITTCLRRGRKRRRHKRAPNRGGIRNKVSISQRPDLSDREEFGHWEGDLIIGKEGQSAMATLVERSSRYTMVLPLEGKSSNTVVNAIIEAMKSMPSHLRKSLTYDQGSEMAEHSRLSDEVNIQVYFADAGKAQQRGTNENTNGLLRQYFPKKTDLRSFANDEVSKVQQKLNARPKGVLKFATPSEVFAQALADQNMKLRDAIL